MKDLHIAKPIKLKCGLTLQNRLVKAATTEQMADKDQLPDAKLIQAYGTWADGGWGLILTGKNEHRHRHQRRMCQGSVLMPSFVP